MPKIPCQSNNKEIKDNKRKTSTKQLQVDKKLKQGRAQSGKSKAQNTTRNQLQRGLSKQLQKKHDLVKKRKAKKLARERERKRLQAIKKIMKYKVSGKVYASEEDDKPEIFNGEFHTSQEAASAAWTWVEDLVGGAQWEWSIMHERYGEQEVGNVMQETEDSEPEEDFINYIKKKGEVKIFCEYNPKVVSFVMVERI